MSPGIKMKSNYLNARGKVENDEKMMEYLISDLSSITGIESLKDKQNLHYFDYFCNRYFQFKRNFTKTSCYRFRIQC